MPSQLELVAALRAARPVAPRELRERVRFAASQVPPARRRISWRRAPLVLAPVALAAVLAAALLPRGDETPTATHNPYAGAAPAAVEAQTTPGAAAGALRSLAPAATDAAKVPAPSAGRAQRFQAELTLRVKDAAAVSAAAQEALRIATSLGGHPQTVQVDASGRDGSAYLVLRVPKQRVQTAVQRLSELGKVVGANVRIQDLQAGVDASARQIARLQERLAALREQPQTEETQQRIAALTAQIERKQRARAATLRAAAFATVELRLQTPPREQPVAGDGDGPLHGLGVAFRWIGIGAVYALALGAPLVLLGLLLWLAARAVRRRREEALLSSP